MGIAASTAIAPGSAAPGFAYTTAGSPTSHSSGPGAVRHPQSLAEQFRQQVPSALQPVLACNQTAAGPGDFQASVKWLWDDTPMGANGGLHASLLLFAHTLWKKLVRIAARLEITRAALGQWPEVIRMEAIAYARKHYSCAILGQVRYRFGALHKNIVSLHHHLLDLLAAHPGGEDLLRGGAHEALQRLVDHASRGREPPTAGFQMHGALHAVRERGSSQKAEAAAQAEMAEWLRLNREAEAAIALRRQAERDAQEAALTPSQRMDRLLREREEETRAFYFRDFHSVDYGRPDSVSIVTLEQYLKFVPSAKPENVRAFHAVGPGFPATAWRHIEGRNGGHVFEVHDADGRPLPVRFADWTCAYYTLDDGDTWQRNPHAIADRRNWEFRHTALNAVPGAQAEVNNRRLLQQDGPFGGSRRKRGRRRPRGARQGRRAG